MPQDKTLQQSMGSIAGAFKKAAGQMRVMTNKPVDPDVAYYETLKPDDMKVIEGNFGIEETRKYVMDMEARRRNIRRVR